MNAEVRHTKSPATPPEQRRRIFAFTGLPGVGKSAVAKDFAGMDNSPVVNMGEEMKSQYESMPFADSRRDVPEGTWEMAQSLRKEHGPTGPALASLSRIAAGFVEHNIVVVDGVRSVSEVELFEEVFGCPVHLIAVTADEDVRADRFFSRGDYEYEVVSESAARVMAEEDMKERTQREVSEGLQEAIDYANYHIDNNGSLHESGIQAARLRDDFGPML